jgi:peptide/nickel transport system ATP-binding protein
MSLVLQLKELTVKARIGGAPVPAIRALSFSLEPEKILGLVGESGAGKSMVGRAIAQLLPPGFAITSGLLAFEGQDLVQMPAVQRRGLLGRAIAFIPQAPLTALNPVLTVGAQFDEHLARVGCGNTTERQRQAITLLEAAQLPQGGELLRRYPHQLSGGMCQRVLIAMAFASNPRLVIADEPTTALDVTMQAPIIRLITEMQRRQGTAVIFITHDLRLAAHICDDIVVMYAGRAVESGPARAVLANPAHPYTRCLQLANPSMRFDRRTLYVMPEHMPSLHRLATMSGCHFAPRCPLVADDCRSTAPPEVTITPGRRAACIRVTATAGIVAAEQATVGIKTSSRSVLVVEGLQRDYAISGGLLGPARKVSAVKHASFSIAENEFVALVGESGSGKSTIAKLLVGLEQPDAGRIVLNGTDLVPASARAHQLRAEGLQMVFQDPYSALNPRRRIDSIVTQAMEAGSRQASWDERSSRTKELLAEVGMPADLAARLPGQLSGGQRQRVNIARALCNLPKVLVADEIVSGLDVSIQAQLLNLLARLRAELGFAMLFISHDLSVVRHLCDRVLVMYRGEIVEQGPIETVFAYPQHPHTRALISSLPPDEPGVIWAKLQGN